MQAANRTPPMQSASLPAAPGAADLTRLAALLLAHTPYDGRHDLRLEGVHAVRMSRVNAELFHGIYQPSLCIVAQGAKTLFVGAEVYAYDASRLLVCSLELPVASRVTQATPAAPFVCLKLDLDPQRIAELALRVYPHGLPPVGRSQGVAVGQVSGPIVNAAVRLVELMADERDAGLLGPLVVDELLIRLLRSAVGPRVAQIGHAQSAVQRLARAVDWLRAHYDEPIDVGALARMVHMSPSSFHQHFKAVTTLSPLQFQKALRLREARRLMLTARMDAGAASRQVGYLSASQFSREYGRLFGHAPSRDIARLRRLEAPTRELN